MKFPRPLQSLVVFLFLFANACGKVAVITPPPVETGNVSSRGTNEAQRLPPSAQDGGGLIGLDGNGEGFSGQDIETILFRGQTVFASNGNPVFVEVGTDLHKSQHWIAFYEQTFDANNLPSFTRLSSSAASFLHEPSASASDEGTYSVVGSGDFATVHCVVAPDQRTCTGEYRLTFRGEIARGSLTYRIY